MSKPRICVIGPFPLPHGGMALQAQQLVAGLRREGLEVVVVRTNRERIDFGARVSEIRGIRHFLISASFAFDLLTTLDDVDVVHMFTASHTFFFLYTVVGIVVSRIYRKRIVLNYRGGEAEIFLKRWGTIVKPFFKFCNAVVVPSGFLQSVLAAHGIQASILPNIVDSGLFRYRERTCFRPRLLVTRHLERNYNIECIIRAFRIIKSKYPAAELGIVGEGEEPDESRRLKNLVAHWGLRDVTFYGYVPHDQLFEFYDKYEIYLNASYVDNFPGALMEAFACGLPVVSTKAGGIRYMIDDGATGFLVDLNDHVGMAERVILLVEKPEVASQIAKAARRKCLGHDWLSVFKVLADLYRYKTDGV